jgi:hypothetical protein
VAGRGSAGISDDTEILVCTVVDHRIGFYVSCPIDLRSRSSDVLDRDIRDQCGVRYQGAGEHDDERECERTEKSDMCYAKRFPHSPILASERRTAVQESKNYKDLTFVVIPRKYRDQTFA